jgi:hypothetical protein
MRARDREGWVLTGWQGWRGERERERERKADRDGEQREREGEKESALVCFTANPRITASLSLH